MTTAMQGFLRPAAVGAGKELGGRSLCMLASNPPGRRASLGVWTFPPCALRKKKRAPKQQGVPGERGGEAYSRYRHLAETVL